MKTLVLALMLALLTASPLFSADLKAEQTYTVGVDDVLRISVLQPEQIDLQATVAPDGNVSFPYIGQVDVRGKTLDEIRTLIYDRLADGYMKYPAVSVTLIESRSRKFFVYGEVIKPGTYFLDENTTVLKAISVAGGFTKFGSSSRVKLLRPNHDTPGYQTIKIDIKSVMSGNSEADLTINKGDILVVSEGIF